MYPMKLNMINFLFFFLFRLIFLRFVSMVSVYDFLQEWRRRGSVFFLFHKLHSCYGFSGFRINFHFDFWFIASRPNWSAIYSGGKGWTDHTAQHIWFWMSPQENQLNWNYEMHMFSFTEFMNRLSPDQWTQRISLAFSNKSDFQKWQ